MKTHEAIQLMVLCMIWSNVTDSTYVRIGAVALGLVFAVAPIYARWKK